MPKKLHQTLSRAHFFELIGLSADAVVAIDDEAQILLFNRGAEALFGFGADQAVGASIGLLFQPEARTRIIQLGDRAATGGSPPSLIRVRCRHRNGDELDADASLTALQFKDESVLLLILRRTEVKTVQATPTERLAGTVALAEAPDDLGVEAHLRKATSFPIDIGHDFNNIFAIVLGSLELLEDHVGSNRKSAALLERVVVGTEMGIKLTRRLITLARHHDYRPSDIDLGRFVQSQSGNLAELLGDNIGLAIDMADDLWPCRCDPVRLAAALSHLALNAREAMPDGGSLGLAAVNVPRSEATGKADDSVMLTVSDSGEGMPADVQAEACKPSFSSKSGSDNAGIGLSYLYELINRSGGHLEIDSSPGHGTRVSLRLPRAQPSLKKRPNRVAVAERKTILVVEDDINVRDFAVTALLDLGYGTLAAGTGREALDLLEKIPDIDLLFSDILLPGSMSGVQLLQQARTRWPNLKFLLTSGYAKEELSGHPELSKGFTVIEKPYLILELATRLAEIFENERER